MPGLRTEGEIRDERFWPERGRNKKLGTLRLPAPTGMRTGSGEAEQLEGGGADHGDRADGMKSW